MSPLVSLVITTYNREPYLATAIESVLRQTYAGFELVIWDDGSSDRSVAIAQTYADRDERVRVIAAPHQGRVAALMGAIAQTTGTYLGWIDSDDWLADTALEETVAILQAQPTVGMVYTDYLDVDAAGKTLGYGKRCHIPYSPLRLLVDFMTFHFRLLRRSVFDQVQGLSGSADFIEDYDLCLRLSEVTQIERVQKPLYHYRHHGDNASCQWRLEQVLRSRAAIRQALKRRGLADQYAIEVTLPGGQFRLRRKNVAPSAVTRQPAFALPAPGHCRHWQWLCPLGVVPLLLAGLAAGPARAQSIIAAPDGTNTLVTPNGTQLNITGGRLSGDGTNLFHSFQRFGLSTGEIANFLSTPQIRNILGRIDGSNPSLINGLIQVTGSNANLYLMNPAGIVFGTGASLNVPGSFTATTATGIGFGSTWFNATGTPDFANLNGNPTGFTFANLQPGAIINAGNLAVGQGQSLALVGGTVLNLGQLSAPEGTVTVMAVSGNHLVRLTQPGSLLSLELVPLPTAPTTAPAPTLAQLLTGGNLTSATGITVNNDGTIRLSGSTLNLPVTPGNTLVTGRINTTGQTGGTVQLLGTQVGVVGANIDASGLGNGGTVLIGGDYRGQGTIPNAQKTFVDSTSVIAANSLLNGNGGRAIVWADDTTRFFGNIAVQGGRQAGNGGFIEISGKNFLTFNGKVDASAVNGTVGTVLFDPTTLTIIDAPAGNGSFDTVPGYLPDIFAADPDVGLNTVSWGQLALAGANIILEASGNITIDPIANGSPITLGGTAQLNLGPAGSLTIRSTGGTVTFADTTNTIATNGGAVTISGTSLTLGDINTSRNFVTGNGGAINLTATAGDIVTGDLTGNGYNAFGPGPITGGTITVTSNTGRITTGTITSTRNPTAAGTVSGNTVTLTTGSNGGDIAFQSIDTRGGGTGASGGNVIINARGMVRGLSTLTTVPTATIATLGETASGTVTITHDGGPNNIPFVVNDTSVTATSGNGLFGEIDAGFETITNQTFPYSPTPAVSPLGLISITFANTAPTLTTNSPIPGAVKDTPFAFTTATVNPIRTDANADNPSTLTITSIAPGATLRVNGVNATPGTILPPGASLEFIPPPGFTGTINAFVLSATDNIQTVSQAVAINVTPPFIPPSSGGSGSNPGGGSTTGTPTNLCILTSCTVVKVIVDPIASISVETANEPTPDRGFTDEFVTYLGVPLPTVKPLNEQRQILQEIEQATGAKPAIIYVSFVPELMRFGNNANMDELDSDQLELVMVTATGNPIRKRLAGATRKQVLALAGQFRNEVSDPRKTRLNRYLPLSQQLYQWIIAPITPDLEARGINNLVFIMESGLRSLPVAALHNGSSFLIEQYSVGVMPSMSLTDTRYQDIRGVQVLGMGISESTQNQPPLPAVPIEVSTLVNQIWTGREALNNSVTRQNLQLFRQQQPFGIIHLATHADFQPGAISNSYIQLWDEKLRLDQVRDMGWNNPQIELLVLSACATALGNREAELGFGGLAVQAGVKTAVASLWYVSDAATTALMTGFYRDLKDTRIKSEALRRAQLAMAQGQVTVEDGKLRGIGPIPIDLPPESAVVRDRQLSHPYYWSAFTMIGSPW